MNTSISTTRKIADLQLKQPLHVLTEPSSKHIYYCGQNISETSQNPI